MSEPNSRDLTLPAFLARCAALNSQELNSLIRADQSLRWQCGQPEPVERYLELLPHLADQPHVLVDLIYAEFLLRERNGERPSPADYVTRFPALAAQLQRQFDLHQFLVGAMNSQTPEQRGQAREASVSVTEGPSLPGYQIVGELGRGGMGVVYKAIQVLANRIVGLKMMLGSPASSDDRTRFKTEAEAVARLQHPNVVQVFEVGEQAGRPFFSMEYCEGGSLKDKLEGNPLPPIEAASLLEKLALAVEAAHQEGVVHRDLKPANVLLSAQGTPKVTDFGLAKKLDEVGQTQTGAVMGTPNYMAPEQARGATKQIGPAADVYALGAVLYECLTGRPPFWAATTVDTILQVLSNDPVPVRQLQPNIPKDLETICLKCLQKQSDRRYRSAQHLADDLNRFLIGEPIKARPVGLTCRDGRRCPPCACHHPT